MSQTYLPRTDQSVLGHWWWTVDRVMLGCFLLLIAAGLILVPAASPAVARTLGIADELLFIKRHLIYLIPTLAALFGVSLLNLSNARRLAFLVLIGSLILSVLVLYLGSEVKGAQRWIRILGFSVQPSEFIKPALAVTAAWFFARQIESRADGVDFPGNLIALGFYGAAAGLIIAQPDFGTTVLISIIFFGQFFLAGLPIRWIFTLSVLGLAAVMLAYLTLPHVTSRVDRFLYPESGDTYQVDNAIQAFGNGGILGTGPGHGTIKYNLPDAHSDFIFAVAGEEMGLVACLLLLGIYALITLHGFRRLAGETDLFVFLAISGLLILLGMQALIHMGSALHLLPAKGMTLPFISYGGSSLLATGFTAGLLLALTRRRVGAVSGSATARRHKARRMRRA